MKTALISVSWLKENLNNSDLVILNATIPPVNGSSADKNLLFQIKGARFFDLKNIFSDTTSKFPNMMPSPQVFEEGCREIGINSNSRIIVYDNKGIYSSPRAWFMFKAMGHNDVAVLDGGLPEWIKYNGECESINSRTYPKGDFKVSFDGQYIKNATHILNNIDSKEYIIIDARNKDRFLGKVPEPRKHLKMGHIPNSFNLPYGSLLHDNKFLSRNELTKKFKSLKIANYPLIFYCGSGITACILLLAATLSINNRVYLYDGSWSQWGNGENFPIIMS